jgi:hypothetical protein
MACTAFRWQLPQHLLRLLRSDTSKMAHVCLYPSFHPALDLHGDHAWIIAGLLCVMHVFLMPLTFALRGLRRQPWHEVGLRHEELPVDAPSVPAADACGNGRNAENEPNSPTGRASGH